jgi:hypothetical protein
MHDLEGRSRVFLSAAAGYIQYIELLSLQIEMSLLAAKCKGSLRDKHTLLITLLRSSQPGSRPQLNAWLSRYCLKLHDDNIFYVIALSSYR